MVFRESVRQNDDKPSTFPYLFIQHQNRSYLSKRDCQTIFLCFLGFFLCIYAINVEQKQSRLALRSQSQSQSNGEFWVGVNKTLFSSFYTYGSESAESSSLCDINSYISCTSTLASNYSRLIEMSGIVKNKKSILNQPNAIIGCIYYIAVLIVILLKYFIRLYYRSAENVIKYTKLVKERKKEERKEEEEENQIEMEEGIKSRTYIKDNLLKVTKILIVLPTVLVVLLHLYLEYIALVKLRKL